MAQIVPRPAATLILLRDASEGPEIFMLKRSPSAAFVANAYVFPGGSLDSADHKALDRVRGLTETEANRRLGVDTGGLAYWVAAVRECFEEAGLLLARDAEGQRALVAINSGREAMRLVVDRSIVAGLAPIALPDVAAGRIVDGSTIELPAQGALVLA